MKFKFNSQQYSLKEILKPKNCALLVIDIQNRFCHPQEKFAKDGKNIHQMQTVIPHIKKLIDLAYVKNIPIIFTKIYDQKNKLNMPGRRRYLKWLETTGKSFLIGPKEGTFGAEFYKLVPKPKDIILTKYDWSAFAGRDKRGKNLKTILKEKNITTLIITGIKTEVCVGTTVRDAYTRGYFVVVPKETVGSDNQELHIANLKNFDPIYGDVVNEKVIIQNWNLARRG